MSTVGSGIPRVMVLLFAQQTPHVLCILPHLPQYVKDLYSIIAKIENVYLYAVSPVIIVTIGCRTTS